MTKKKNIKKRRKTLATAGSVCLAVIILIGAIALRQMNRSIVSERHVLLLHENTAFGVLLDSLREGGKISDVKTFERLSRLMKLGDTVKEGRYELKRGMNARDVVGMFRSGNQSPINVTFNNIRTLEEFAGKLGAILLHDSLEFITSLTATGAAAEYGFTQAEFIGMFIPNTYQVYWNVSPEAFVKRMSREYDRFWDETRTEKLARVRLTAKEVSALASIVEEETVRASEMSTIAGVYINRLRKGIPLQADPTVKFAVGNPELRRVRYKHLETDSPYNTYRNRGLPPGPIRMPSIQAIDAVLDYKQHDYLFFCAKSDFSGYHVFAKTLAEHNRNAQAYSRALNAAGIR